MLKVTVDGVQVEVEHGATILAAAKKAGVRIPTFCHDDRIAPTGACRICLVEVEGGPPRLYASCVTPAMDNMVVKTNSEKIARGRRTNIELLLVHHPLDCPVCPASGACGLQDLTFEFGVQSSRFLAERKEKETDRSNPCIEHDDNRCVLCSKCVRVCSEIQGVSAIGLVRRGSNACVDTPFGNKLDCDFCGHCVTTCPVGARNNRFIMKGRAWNVRNVKSLCSFCGTGCSMSYNIRDRDKALVQARAIENLGINGNFQCSKGWQGFQYVNSDDRLTKPMLRKNNELVQVEWSEAIAKVSKNFKEIIDKHGKNAVAGIGSERMTNEENFLFQKFFRTVIGSNQIDNILNMKNKAAGEGLMDTLGGLKIAPLEVIGRAPLIFLIGADAAEESPVVGNMIRMALTRSKPGLIVVNNRNIRFSKDTSLAFKINVGTEAALINGLIHEILAGKHISEKTAASRIENLDKLKDAVSEYTPEYTEKTTGTPAGQITGAAGALASSESAAFVCGRDIIEFSRNKPAFEALRNLVLLTGNGAGDNGGLILFREFCNSQGVNDMGVTPGHAPGYQAMDDPAVRTKLGDLWNKGMPLPDDSKKDIIQQAIEGKVKALYIMGEDLLARYPDGKKVREALEKVDFVVCQDIFLTGTADFANVVLPGVSFAEKIGTFTNMEGRAQKLVRQIDPIGESIPDLEIICKIADALGSKLTPDTPEGIMEEIIRVSPAHEGIWEANGLAGYARTETKPGPTARIPTFTPPKQADGDFPFTLVTGNLLHHLGPCSRKSEALNAISPNSFIEINPKDKNSLGIKNGDILAVESAHGKLALPAKVSAKSPQGVVFIPVNFEKSPVNQLISGEEDVTRVRISKV